MPATVHLEPAPAGDGLREGPPPVRGGTFKREVGRLVRAGLALHDVRGIPHNTLGYIERGENGCSVEKLCEIAEALGVSVVSLIPECRRGESP